VLDGTGSGDAIEYTYRECRSQVLPYDNETAYLPSIIDVSRLGLDSSNDGHVRNRERN
jgi:hypothetical protein